MNRNIALGAGLAAGLQLARFLSRPSFELKDKVVFITGGSRGLGLVLAREFAALGARVAIAARDGESLQRAAADLRACGADVFEVELDVSLRGEAETAVERIRQNLGPVDVLVNNAGTICVGPLEAMTEDDFRDSINTHFWGPYYCTMAVLGEMKRRRRGRIVNISSIGGKVSVPHLLPYSVGKFALTGLSQGLRSALLQEGIFVTTVCPGLMRAGSPRNALFKGDNEKEYAWFSISDALPILSMNAERAARRIVTASVRGDAEVILTLPANVAVVFQTLFPEMAADLMALADRFLPAAGDSGRTARTGKQSFSNVSPSWVTTLNEQAAKANNEIQ